jgi:hypothetical protein
VGADFVDDAEESRWRFGGLVESSVEEQILVVLLKCFVEQVGKFGIKTD